MPTATATRTSTELIAEDFVKTRQALEYTNIVSCVLHRGGTHHIDATKFRVVIKRDSFEFQSYARVETWRADGWSVVHALRGEDPRVADLPTYTCRDLVGARAQFGDLSTDLLDIAVQVVA